VNNDVKSNAEIILLQIATICGPFRPQVRLFIKKKTERN